MNSTPSRPAPAENLIDAIARDRALNRFGVPLCLHVPIAAIDEAAIAAYIGDIVRPLSRGSTRRALLVARREPPAIDRCYPISDDPGAGIFHEHLQVWVHVAYNSYRAAYRRAFPGADISGLVLSHAMNRRVAALKGFGFVRITPTSRRANSSSAFSEDWGVALHRSPRQMAANGQLGAFIQYADLTELMLMLDMNLGGGVMDAVNAGQRLLRPRSGEGWLAPG